MTGSRSAPRRPEGHSAGHGPEEPPQCLSSFPELEEVAEEGEGDRDDATGTDDGDGPGCGNSRPGPKNALRTGTAARRPAARDGSSRAGRPSRRRSRLRSRRRGGRQFLEPLADACGGQILAVGPAVLAARREIAVDDD